MSTEELHRQYLKDPSPRNLAALLDALQPMLNAESSRYPGPPALLRGKARQLAIAAIRSYQPESGAKLTSWVISSMQSLNRYGRRMQQGVRIPELAFRQSMQMENNRQRLIDELGRDPTDVELADSLGVSVRRIAGIQSAVKPTVTETALEEAGVPELAAGGKDVGDPRLSAATDLVLDSLEDRDKEIYELKTGKRGDMISNNEVATRLGVSPAYISQRSDRIAKRILEAQKYV